MESYQEGALRSKISIDWDMTGTTFSVKFQDNAGNISEWAGGVIRGLTIV
jgi:hypothetical protein